MTAYFVLLTSALSLICCQYALMDIYCYHSGLIDSGCQVLPGALKMTALTESNIVNLWDEITAGRTIHADGEMSVSFVCSR